MEFQADKPGDMRTRMRQIILLVIAMVQINKNALIQFPSIHLDRYRMRWIKNMGWNTSSCKMSWKLIVSGHGNSFFSTFCIKCTYRGMVHNLFAEENDSELFTTIVWGRFQTVNGGSFRISWQCTSGAGGCGILSGQDRRWRNRVLWLR